MTDHATPSFYLSIMRSLLIILVLGLSLTPSLLTAQRLMWEQASIPPGAPGPEAAVTITLTGNQRFLMMGGHALPISVTSCVAAYRVYFREQTLTGAVLQEKRGRGLSGGSVFSYAIGSPGVGWFTGPADVCVGTRHTPRALIQRVTVTGDTGRAWYTAPAPPETKSSALLVQGNKIITAGHIRPIGVSGQIQQAQLTCSDTLGNVRWQHNYARQPSSLDEIIAVAPTPRGGYLLSGDAYDFQASGYSHYVVEADSLGQFRRSRLIQPLGPGYNDGSRVSTECNIITLPNAQGYLLSGMADSLRQGIFYKRTGYVMRLDTSLNVQWVYRHPAALAGTNATQNYAYRLRLLPNGTVGLMLTDVRNAGTPDVFIAQVDMQTGRRVALYTMSSNTQAVVVPWDWHWVGDGTLLLCGYSLQTGVTYKQSYVARWDFRATPLAARTAAAARAAATFYAFPNPASGPVTLHWHLPPGQRAGAVRLYSLLGQLLRTVVLPPAAEGQQEVAGLAAGLYVARLLDEHGRGQGSAVRLVVE